MAGEDHGPRRIVVEKPFGTDLASARQLNRKIHEVFAESQVYRIDHYLGKETVQNVLVLRFANTIFEPVWNRNYIDHVQITAAESLTVGHRAGYYDTAGVLRDMLQNHLLQLLTLTAMEAPVRFEADAVRDEKVKVLRAVRPMQTGGRGCRHVARPVSRDTATNPACGRTARRPPSPWSNCTSTTGAGRACPSISAAARPCPAARRRSSSSFASRRTCCSRGGPRDPRTPTAWSIQIQPAEGIQLHFHTKVPDAGMQLRMTDLNFRFREKFAGAMPEAYQRLLLDVIHGDASLFARSDEVEAAWGIVDPIQSAWDTRRSRRSCRTSPEMWGPAEATEWMERQGGRGSTRVRSCTDPEQDLSLGWFSAFLARASAEPVHQDGRRYSDDYENDAQQSVR